MQVVETLDAMRALSDDLRSSGLRVAFVPTMGYLHDGHLALVRRARSISDIVIASIFVNPLQFAPSEDLERYPRDASGDIEKLETATCDILFLPDGRGMYPPDFATSVSVDGVSRLYEGAFRPDHFRGVATVVTKLLNIVRPHVAVFGRKDAQQLAVIRRLAGDLDTGVQIEAVDTIRDADGLARSSRNVYLSPDERQRALALSAALRAACDEFNAGASLDSVRTVMHEILASQVSRIDYADVVDETTFAPATAESEGPLLAIIAAHVGRTRLIDNAVLRA